MSNDGAHMWALDDMSSARAVDQLMPSFCIREWSGGALERQAGCGSVRTSPSTQLLPTARGESPLLRRLERKAAELTLVEMARDATVYTSSAVGTCYF